MSKRDINSMGLKINNKSKKKWDTQPPLKRVKLLPLRGTKSCPIISM